MADSESPADNWILVVDDEAAIRGMMQSALEMVGHKVEAASGGEEALEMLEKKCYALMVLDSKMPGLSGLDVLRKLKDFSPENRPKVLLTTGRISSLGSHHRLGLEVVNVMRKPFQIKDLHKAVENAFKGLVP